MTLLGCFDTATNMLYHIPQHNAAVTRHAETRKRTEHTSSETAAATQIKRKTPARLYLLCSPLMAGFCRGSRDTTCPVSQPKYARLAMLMNSPVSTTPTELQHHRVHHRVLHADVIRCWSSSSAIRLHSQLIVPRTRTSYGDRSFAVHGPIVWNSLPHDLRSTDISLATFRNRLKTFPFDTDT